MGAFIILCCAVTTEITVATDIAVTKDVAVATDVAEFEAAQIFLLRLFYVSPVM